jgi:hypothetical protein
MNKEETPEELMAQDIVYWIKNDIGCLYIISEIKKELKPLSKERYDYWDNIHTIVLNKFGINREI